METENKDKIVFDCPQCKKKLSVEKKHAGISARCPNCGKRIEIPSMKKSK